KKLPVCQGGRRRAHATRKALLATTRDGYKNATVVMTIWLKRVGASNGPYDMPHQSKDAIRMIVWVDSPSNLFLRTNGHLLLPTEMDQWWPNLHLETGSPGPLLPVLLETSGYHYRRVWGAGQRPYSFRVDLPDGVGDCFKIVEASYPMHKNTFCLPPAAQESVCANLAPPHVHTNKNPALYTVIGPIRHPESTREWSAYYSKVSGILVNYVTYQVAMGASGLLLYADELMRKYFGENQELMALVVRGQLRLIEWDMPERAHKDTDGVGRPLGYNYDQGLVSSHILLALSSCGANLLVLIGDLDEHIYTPKARGRRPRPWTRCMGLMEGNSTDPVTTHRIKRFNTETTKVDPSAENDLWAVPGTLNARVNGDGTIDTIPNGAVPHPLAHYDAVHSEPLPINQVKQVSLPAAWVVLFWVHEGVPLYGRTNMVPHQCMSILHIVNLFRGRHTTLVNGNLAQGKRYFRHWMFLPESANASLWQL
ncbi:hypothetical protein Vretifemale_7844, partial [Volvox reticuliferus]